MVPILWLFFIEVLNDPFYEKCLVNKFVIFKTGL
jgi:hypothetical protein